MDDIKIITLNTKIKDIVDIPKSEYSGWNDSLYNSDTTVLEMTLAEFLTQSLRVSGFGKTKYRKVIRAAVFSEFIDYDARETLLESVL